jgi:two-component system, OmpR family, response regulator ResD
LPDIDGFEVCRTIRTFSQVPIIMVTARGDDEDKVQGLGLGSDDYVVKPFNPRELVARVKRMLERARLQVPAAPPSPAAAATLAWNDLEVDMVRRRVQSEGRVVALTPKEYDLLVYLMSNPEQVLSRDTLLREVWGSEAYEARSVDVHVKYLREKLGERLAGCVQTVWGKGYKLSATPKT